MRILHTLDNSNRGGIQELILNLHKYSHNQHEFVAADGSMANEIREAGMMLYNGSVAAGAEFDVVVGHTVGGWSGEGSAQFARERGAKFVECMHSIYHSPTPPEVCDGFIALSDLALEQNQNMPNGKRIYGILDGSKFGMTGVEDGPIGRFSRLAQEKGVMEFAILARNMPDYLFVCGGEGAMLGELMAIKPANLYFPGWITDKPKFLSKLGLFVFPTHDECCCMSVAQAQMAGVPVICSMLPALAETTGGNAVFCESLPAMSGAIDRYFQDSSFRSELLYMAEMGRKWAFRNFDKSVTIKAWDRYIEEL